MSVRVCEYVSLLWGLSRTDARSDEGRMRSSSHTQRAEAAEGIIGTQHTRFRPPDELNFALDAIGSVWWFTIKCVCQLSFALLIWMQLNSKCDTLRSYENGLLYYAINFVCNYCDFFKCFILKVAGGSFQTYNLCGLYIKLILAHIKYLLWSS